MSVYPAQLDGFTNPVGTDKQSDEVGGLTHSEMHGAAFDAIEAIEGELGTNPSGNYATVKARLDAVDAAIADGVENYVHIQNSNATLWSITHNLGMYPNVTIVEFGGSNVEGVVTYVTQNQITVQFTVAIAGHAYLS